MQTANLTNMLPNIESFRILTNTGILIIKRGSDPASVNMPFHRWWRGVVVNALVVINKVTLRRARLVLGWVTVCRRITISVCNQPPRSTQPGHPSVGRRNEYQRKLGSKQAHRAIH